MPAPLQFIETASSAETRLYRDPNDYTVMHAHRVRTQKVCRL